MSTLTRCEGDSIGPAMRTVRALGTTAVVVVVDACLADRAVVLLEDELHAIDEACSRFRPDSEIRRVEEADGKARQVSPLLFEALQVAVDVARRTAGAVDPTVGGAIESLGYDRDFEEIAMADQPGSANEAAAALEICIPETVEGWRSIELDAHRRAVRVPRGVRLDLGASAKALVTDRAARKIAARTGSGTLVSVGGDVSVAGVPPEGGWAVGIAVDSSTEPGATDQVVAIESGGIASSSTVVRRWRRAGQEFHHIVDPHTGWSADPYWRLVSAAGSSCVEANAASTAAIVWGVDAVDKLGELGQPARLVRHDGLVITVKGWPVDHQRVATEMEGVR